MISGQSGLNLTELKFKGDEMDKIKITFTVILSALMSFLGILAVPVFLLVGCNVLDYTTGIIASKYRNERISSYRGIKGIAKKICQWLLIIVGSMIDTLINYALETTSMDVKLPFIVAVIVTVWLICNEMISILENIIDIDEKIVPPFLMPLVKGIKKKTEDVAKEKGEHDEGSN